MLSVKKIDEKYLIDNHGVIYESYDIPYLLLEDETKISFKDILINEEITNDTIISFYKYQDLQFKTIVNKIDEEIYFSLIPINEIDNLKEIKWPMGFNFNDINGYSILPYMQGILLPNKYEFEYDKLAFDGFFGSCAAYINCFGQVLNRNGYLLINETPFDSKYEVIHHKDEVGTIINLRNLMSLSKISYERKYRYSFRCDVDYNDLAKIYRKYVIDNGKFKSLKEKMKELPNIKDLIGSSVIHFCIKTNTHESSSYYNHEEPNKNHRLVTFKERLNEYLKLKELYKDKLYIHLDGWAKDGYDNSHPDILPACIEAGGYEDLKTFIDTVQNNGDTFGLHDQYRDYYVNTPTYDSNNALMEKDGTHFTHSRWAGGTQNYLCASLAPKYVKRNFEELFRNGIKPKASYLDVFTCNEMDECFSDKHLMTRSECANYRNACFRYLVENNIIPSSEECTDFAINDLVFAHYGPYEFQMRIDNLNKMGIAIPLFNLVYHDAFILPWMMEKPNEDYMLYALLNAGIPYLIRMGAYENTDGAFDNDDMSIDEKIKRAHIVSSLHETLACDEMIRHEILDSEGKIQKATYESGISITVNFNDNTYSINE